MIKMARKQIGVKVSIFIKKEELDKKPEILKKSEFLRLKVLRDSILFKVFDKALRNNEPAIINYLMGLTEKEREFLVFADKKGVK